MHWRIQWRVLVSVVAVISVPSFVFAQTDQPPLSPPETDQPPPPQIDQNVVNVPTTVSLRKHHSYFRLTHRFARDLRRGSFDQRAEDLFSLDSGAQLDKRDTVFLGLGTRIRFLTTAFVVAEVSPRLARYTPDRAAENAGIGKTTHGHVLQRNFGNTFATTPATTPGMVARGGDKDNVFMGFNLSRKF